MTWYGINTSQTFATQQVSELILLGIYHQVLHHSPNCCNIYTTFITPLLEYGSTLFDNCTTASSEQIEHVHRQDALAITRAYQHTSQRILLTELGLEFLET